MARNHIKLGWRCVARAIGSRKLGNGRELYIFDSLPDRSTSRNAWLVSSLAGEFGAPSGSRRASDNRLRRLAGRNLLSQATWDRARILSSRTIGGNGGLFATWSSGSYSRRQFSRSAQLGRSPGIDNRRTC